MALGFWYAPAEAADLKANWSYDGIYKLANTNPYTCMHVCTHTHTLLSQICNEDHLYRNNSQIIRNVRFTYKKVILFYIILIYNILFLCLLPLLLLQNPISRCQKMQGTKDMSTVYGKMQKQQGGCSEWFEEGLYRTLCWETSLVFQWRCFWGTGISTH